MSWMDYCFFDTKGSSSKNSLFFRCRGIAWDTPLSPPPFRRIVNFLVLVQHTESNLPRRPRKLFSKNSPIIYNLYGTLVSLSPFWLFPPSCHPFGHIHKPVLLIVGDPSGFFRRHHFLECTPELFSSRYPLINAYLCGPPINNLPRSAVFLTNGIFVAVF